MGETAKGRVKSFALPPRRPAALSLFSGLLLALSFPAPGWGFLAWFALAPLFFALSRSTSPWQALGRGLLAGLVFYGISLHWLVNVSAFGWFFLTALETAFFGIFSLAFYAGRRLPNPYLRIFWTGLAWTTMELVRSEIPVFGFGWNLLAYSQAGYPWILQSANAVGAYGLGFVMAMVNAGVREATRDQRPGTSDHKSKNDNAAGDFWSRVTGPLSLVLFLFLLVFAHGLYYSRQNPGPAKTLRISLIQGNVAQDIKWEAEAREKILQLYLKLSELASYEEPDLVIWPEASFPGYFNRDTDAARVADLVKKFDLPLVVGSPHFEAPDTAYNSAYFLGSDGRVEGRYDKQYLVPFGEYIPLKIIFGGLEKLAYSLGVSDFSAGHEPAVFELRPGLKFSVLICFEDIFPVLARRFADRGAQFLAVITNDAWFGESRAPYQHLQASVFRAVENGVPVVRAANTGVSALISAKGEVLGRVHNEKGKDIFVTGKLTSPIEVPVNLRPTLFRRGGWAFPYAAAGAFVIMAAGLRRQTTDHRPQTTD